jgi:hypothetical protein
VLEHGSSLSFNLYSFIYIGFAPNFGKIAKYFSSFSRSQGYVAFSLSLSKGKMLWVKILNLIDRIASILSEIDDVHIALTVVNTHAERLVS